ncbi:MAG: hypothetical protein Q7R73_04950 [bacterium]|nr:hypothetical protein [bacterium]
MAALFEAFQEQFLSDPIIAFLLQLWWLWLLLFVGMGFQAVWLQTRRFQYILKQGQVLLEIRIPREVRKSPKAMEQVFANMHVLKNGPSNWHEKYADGEVCLWYSMEVVSHGGDVHFYMRIPAIHRAAAEAFFYSQYSDIEITEVPDYIHRFPKSYSELSAKKYELFGSELMLNKPDAYPIRTYMDYEAVAEEKELDPIAALLEVLGKFKREEEMWVQILVRPVGSEWRAKGEALVKEFKLKTSGMVKNDAGEDIWQMRSPGETEVLKAVERNIAKPGFETLIRYVYFAPESVYNWKFPYRGITAAFNQYAAADMNSFKNKYWVWTIVSKWYFPFLFASKRRFLRRQSMYQYYRERMMPDEPLWGISSSRSLEMVLNTEELATIYHPPTMHVLTAPLIRRVESRRMGPPAGLPIFGGEDTSELLKK